MPAARLGLPEPQGLYHPSHEHDACGVAMVADVNGRRTHDIVAKALTALCNLDHRGAKGSEPDTGDGAGILTQMPDAFLRVSVDFPLPPAGSYAAGIAFLPMDVQARAIATAMIEEIAAEEGLTVLGWRELPVDASHPGPSARAVMPAFLQLFVSSPGGESGLALDRLVFCLRKRAEHEADVYFSSLSSRTIVYKGMLTTPQLELFFPDLSDERFESAIALVHSRFSTNTFPSWPLAHPYRSATRTARTRPPSTSAWNCSTSAAGACRTPC
jgi:glutamate synthase (NADPH/NADH) large chain